jgi:hypothetical protein
MVKAAKYMVIAGTAVALSLPALANDIQLTAANAVLQTSIDAKTAKVGDVVTAKLTDSVRIAGGTELRRNTLLIGHVDQAQPAENNGVSTVVLTFDKAEPKGGQPTPIKLTIVGVYPNGTDLAVPSLNPQLKVQEEADSAHGYSLTSDVQGSNSGVLKANGKNVRLNDGTELQFAVAPVTGAPSAVGN